LGRLRSKATEMKKWLGRALAFNLNAGPPLGLSAANP